MLSEKRIAFASRRLEALQLPAKDQALRMAALDDEQKQFNERSEKAKQFFDDYKQGKVPDELLEVVKTLVEKPGIKQAQSLQPSVPKLAQRLLGMEWSLHKYAPDAYRFTSDSPFMTIPLARPASENDWEALEVFSMTWLGMVHFYVDEIIQDHPPMAFVLL